MRIDNGDGTSTFVPDQGSIELAVLDSTRTQGGAQGQLHLLNIALNDARSMFGRDWLTALKTVREAIEQHYTDRGIVRRFMEHLTSTWAGRYMLHEVMDERKAKDAETPLYLGLSFYREDLTEDDPVVTECYASVGPFRCIQHTYGGLRLWPMDGSEDIQPQFVGDFLVVDGKYWSDYFFWCAPDKDWNMDPADPKTFAHVEVKD